jgi:hypothetical protein
VIGCFDSVFCTLTTTSTELATEQGNTKTLI